jgi:cobalt-zinc-cadmium resistance protein CzcA
MIDRIIEFSLNRRGFILFVTMGLILGGSWAALKLPIDAVPDITHIQVQLNTEVQALAPEEIEKLVTFPLEMEMSGIQGVTELRSLSKFGLSQVTLVFEEGTDIYRARQLVSERLANAAGLLPEGIHPMMSPISTGLGEILYYTLDYSDSVALEGEDRKFALMELWEVQEYLVKPFMRSVPGIAEINTAGGYERQIVVQPDPEALSNAGITFRELADIVSDNTSNTGGGIIHRGDDQWILRSVGRVVDESDIGNIPVKFASGVEPLKVRDLASISIGSNIRTGAALEMGKEAVLGTVMMLAGENSRIIAKRAAAKLQELQDKLPGGMEIRVQYDRSNVVDRTIATVKSNLFEGAILVIVVLLILLGNWKAALIVAAAIPLSFLFAITGMVHYGISGNLMSLGAVDFGLIIDGAVVMVENIVRRLGERQHRLGRPLNIEERVHTILVASKQISQPMFFGVVIITIVYIPILALTGIEGKMFRPMAFTVMLALGGALVLAVTLMPVLCSFFLGGRITEKDNIIVAFIKKIYRPSLLWAVRNSWVTLVGAVLIFLVSLWKFNQLGAEFVPTLDEGSFTAMVYQPASTSLKTSLKRARRTEAYLTTKIPEVTRTFSRIGTSEVATDPMSPGEYDLYIFYKPQSEWRKENGKTITKERLVELISNELSEEVPEQTYFFAQPIEMRFNEMLEGIRSDIAVKVFGEDIDQMESVAEQIKEILESLPGTAEAEFETQGRTPVLEFVLDRAAAARWNVHMDDVNETIRCAMAGQTTGIMIDGNRRRDLVLRLSDEDREQLEILLNLPVRTHDGGLVRLEQLVNPVRKDEVDAISRESGQRRVAIMVNIAKQDVESYVNEAVAKIDEAVVLPEGIRIEFGGQFENLRQARARLMIVVPLALVLIFVLVYAALGSLAHTVLVYTGIPLAVTGGVLALWVRGIPFSISAGVGFIALSGVAVLNGLVLINCFNELRRDGESVLKSVETGAMQRLRPVFMTAMVASLGFVPMAVATGAGAEVQKPLATVVIGGILSSTFLTLVLLPALYAKIEEWLEARKQSTSNQQI